MTEVGQYPIDSASLNREAWNRKVNATLMSSFAHEEETLPILVEIQALVSRLLDQPIEATLRDKESQEFFLSSVLPPTCQKLISSRYFRSQQVLSLANSIMEMSMELYRRHPQHVWTVPKFAELVSTVLDPDSTYFRTNNQLQLRTYPWQYYPSEPVRHEFLEKLLPGDHVDLLKFDTSIKKASWSRAEVIKRIDNKLELQFLNDSRSQARTVDDTSVELAPVGVRSLDYEWRMALKVGDLVDCCEMEGSWYLSTITKLKEGPNGSTIVKVGLRVYSEDGQKHDSKGYYVGLAQNFDIDNVDVTSPRIQKPGTLSKAGDYSYNRGIDIVKDYNDQAFESLNGERLLYFPREKYQSEVLFRIARKFIREGGYQQLIERLRKQNNWDVLVPVCNSLGNISANFHKKYLQELVDQLKPIVHRHMVDHSQGNTQQFSREKCDLVFRGMKALLKRIQTVEQTKNYENTEKLGLTLLCINSETLKRRIQGVNELKDVVRTYRTYLTSKIPELVEWLTLNNIFDKVFVTNTHCEIIKRSGQYFRFLVLESALSNQQLAQMFRTALRSDHDTKLTYYKILEEVSRHMKKEQINLIIDWILEGESRSVTGQDINLLYDLEKESNYFPLQKVLPFFERIFLYGRETDQIVETCLKKYIDVVSSKERKDTVKRFLNKLKEGEGNPDIVIRILRSIIDAEYSRYDLLDLLQQSRIDEVILQRVRSTKANNGPLQTIRKLLQFLSWSASLSQSRVKISIETLVQLWRIMIQRKEFEQEAEIFYEWTKVVCKEEELADPTLDNLHLYSEFFEQLTSSDKMASLTQKDLNLVKYLFLAINRASSKLMISSVMRNHKQTLSFKFRADFPEFVFYDTLLKLLYEVNGDAFHSIFSFYRTLYFSQEIAQSQRMKYLETTRLQFFRFYELKDLEKVARCISLLECIIQESEREGDANLQSFAGLRRGDPITLDIVNDTTFISDINRKLKLKTNSNITLLSLKKLIGKLVNVHWSELRLTQKEELDELFNSRFLQDIGIRLSQPITVTKKISITVRQQPIIIDDKLNPKAIQAINKIFVEYSTEGRMDRDQCRKFIGGCLNDHTKLYQDKLDKLFSDYDPQKKEYLEAPHIVDFFEKAALSKAAIVQSNFKNLGIRRDFRLLDEGETECKQEELPRYVLSRDSRFYEVVFDMLDCSEQMAKSAWRLLERLPISQSIYDQVTKIDEESLAVSERIPPYKLMYCLELYEYFLRCQSLSEKELQWRQHFLTKGGYNELFKLFCSLNQKPTMRDIEKRLLEFLLRMLCEYVCSPTKVSSSSAIAILNSELDLGSILEFFKTGEIPKGTSTEAEQEYIKLANLSKTQNIELDISFDRDTMISELIRLLERLSTGASNIEAASEIRHSFSLLLHLLYGRAPPQQLLDQLQLLLKNASDDLSQKTFKLILALTVASPLQSECSTIIIEWLFNLQSRTNSYHLKALIVLVDKHGIPAKIRDSPNTLINVMLESENEYLIGGCSQLLYKIQSSYGLFDSKTLRTLWDKCLFGTDAKCKSTDTRQSLYELILKLVESNQELSGTVWQLLDRTLDKVRHKQKLISPNDLQGRSPFGYSGLKNIGNICYMLAILQQLYHNPTFRHMLLRIDDSKPPNIATVADKKVDDNILHQLRRMFCYLQSTTRLDFAPYDFCFSFKGFNGQPVNVGIQQDAQEFVSMIFDKLEEAIKNTPFKRVIDTIYRGKLTNTLTCSKCKKGKSREQIFYSLQADIRNSKTLTDSLKKLCQGETISDYQCDFCNEKADVSKTSFISHCPNFIIVHLQRIVFNMDTLVNEKINSKFEFPMEINLSEYIGQQEPNSELTDEYQYELKGVVAHYGTAEAGHYYSFVKSQQLQWLEINDSKVSSFDIKNIETECFGSNNTEPSYYEDQYEISKREHSRNAYMVIYEKKKKAPVQLVFGGDEQKKTYFDKYSLLAGEEHRTGEARQTLEESPEGDFQEEPVCVRKVSKEYMEVEANKPQPVQVQQQKPPIDVKEEKQPAPIADKQVVPNKLQIIVNVMEPVAPYLPEQYMQEITEDNLLHKLEVDVSAPAFIKFYSKLLKMHLPADQSSSILELTRRMIFKMWMKNPAVKSILESLQTAIHSHPEVAMPILRDKSISIDMLENSDTDMRTSLSLLLASCVASIVESNKLPLKGDADNDLDVQVTLFLNDLFGQLTQSVAKHWQKFSQWFDFWRNLAAQSNRCLQYLLDRSAISHLLAFHLQKKSPLKIFSDKKYTLGNRYTQPNFNALFDLVGYLLEQTQLAKYKLTADDRLILTDHSFVDKVISEKNEKLSKKIVQATCVNSLFCSQRVALVLLRGFNKGFENVQPYLEVAETLLTIQDRYQDLRIMWVMGKPSLIVSTEMHHLVASNSSSFEERIFNYNSTIHYDYSPSILESLFKSHLNIFNSSALTLKGLLRLCLHDKLFEYVYNLPPPNYVYGRYYCFFGQFITSYKREAEYPNSYAFPRKQLAKELEELHQSFLKRLDEKYKHIEKVDEKHKHLGSIEKVEKNNSEPPPSTFSHNTISGQYFQQGSQFINELPPPIRTNDQLVSMSGLTDVSCRSEYKQECKQQKEQKKEEFPQDKNRVEPVLDEQNIIKVYYPIGFQYSLPEHTQQDKNVKLLISHSHKVKFMLMPIDCNKEQQSKYFASNKSHYRIKDRLIYDHTTTKLVSQTYKGVLIRNNNSIDGVRIKWEHGSCYIRSRDSLWLWTDQTQGFEITKCQKQYDWPSWSMYKNDG